MHYLLLMKKIFQEKKKRDAHPKEFKLEGFVQVGVQHIVMDYHL